MPASGTLLTRRAAILQALAGIGAATGAIAGVSILARGSAPARAVATAGTALADSAAVTAGDALSVTNPLDGSPALLVRDADGVLVAFDATCTHAGCEVGWVGGEIRCPCHHARFDTATGEPTRGPARAPLEVLSVVEREGKILLT